MDSGKAWWASKGVWGGVVAAASGVAGLFGANVDEAAQAQMTEAIISVCSTLSMLGGVVAIIGRIRADKKIGK